MPPATETDTANRMRIAVMRLARVLRSTEAGMAAELTPTRVSVLLNVMRNGPVRLGDVAEEEGLNPTLLSRTVAHLADEGLLTRSPDADDRRTAWLEMTQKGRKLALAIRRQRNTAIERALVELSPAERELIEAALPALENLFEALAR